MLKFIYCFKARWIKALVRPGLIWGHPMKTSLSLSVLRTWLIQSANIYWKPVTCQTLGKLHWRKQKSFMKLLVGKNKMVSKQKYVTLLWWHTSVQSLSRVLLFATPLTAAPQASLSITNCRSLLKLTSINSVMPSNHLLLYHPLLLLPSVFCSIRVFPSEVSSSYQVAKVLQFQLQHQSFQWIFRTDFPEVWLVGSPCSPGTLKSLFQHHSSKASILWCSAFFIVQLSYPYMTTGKTIPLTRWTFVSKVILCFLICCLGWS